MLKSTSIALLMISTPSIGATIATGGHFNAGYTSGWTDGVNNYNPALLDNTGLQYGTPVSFSAPVIYPWPLTISVDTPNYGELTVALTTADYLDYTPGGEFFELRGTINGGGWAILDVNLPYYVVSSFGLMGQFAYSPPPPVVVQPPPVVLPPIGKPIEPPTPPVIEPPTPPAVTVPETSTWVMMILGFIGLGWVGLRRRPQF